MNNKYVIHYFVGIFDGEGSAQVNHWRKKNLQYRLVIKLKNTEANTKMLKTIANEIGGHVKEDKEDVLWVENHKKRITEILELMDLYPPLTTRVQCQIAFIRTCMGHNDVNKYLLDRKLKYDLRQNYKPNRDITKLSYWPAWLSGFIEAEGCFSRRASGYGSFSIGQKYEDYIIVAIRSYFGIVNKIVIRNNNFYVLETYNKQALERIREHCEENMLLGEKKQSYKKYLKEL